MAQAGPGMGAMVALVWRQNLKLTFCSTTCVGEWELIQPSSPYNAIMDSNQQCKIHDRGGGKGREEGKRRTSSGLGL